MNLVNVTIIAIHRHYLLILPRTEAAEPTGKPISFVHDPNDSSIYLSKKLWIQDIQAQWEEVAHAPVI